MNPRNLDPDNRIANTVVCATLHDLLQEAPRIGHCLRCLVPVDPNHDDWSLFAQAGKKVGSEYLVGGVLCGPCVGSWGQWLTMQLDD